MSTQSLTKSQWLLYSIIRLHGGQINDKTKLAKLEYFADFIHYAFHSVPISSVQENIYTRQKQGALSRTLTADLEKLKESGLIDYSSKYSYKIKKDKEIPLTREEFKTIKFVLEKYGDREWEELVDICHNQTPYLSAPEKGVIEYFTAFNLVDEYPDYAKYEA